MKLAIQVEGSKALIKASGAMTVQTAPDLSAAVEKLDSSVCDMVIDMSDVMYVASAGLRALASVDKLSAGRGGTMLLLHPTDAVIDALNMTGLSDVFAIER